MKVHIDKSIKYGRILYKWEFESIFVFAIDCIFWGVLPVCSILIFSEKPYELLSMKQIMLVCGVMMISLWVLSGWYLRGKLVRIEGGGLPDNREDVLESLKLWFPTIPINSRGIRNMKNNKKIGFFAFGNELSLLFDADNAYINRTTFGRYDIGLSYHAPLHYLYLLRFKKAFLRKSIHNDIS